MGSLPLLLVCDQCGKDWVSGGVADPGDFGIHSGSCPLENDLQSVRFHLRCWFSARLHSLGLEIVAQFLVGSESGLKQMMKRGLLEICLVGKDYGYTSSFTILCHQRMSDGSGEYYSLFELVMAFVCVRR